MLILSFEANSAASKDCTFLWILEHCVGREGGWVLLLALPALRHWWIEEPPSSMLQCCLGCVSCFWFFVFLEARKLGLSPLLLLLLAPQHNRATPPNASQICLSCNWMCARNVHQMGGGRRRRFGCAWCCLIVCLVWWRHWLWWVKIFKKGTTPPASWKR